MPPTATAGYSYKPQSITAKRTDDAATAAELVAQVVSVQESQAEREIDETKFIGLDAAVNRPMGKSATDLELSLKALSPAFLTMCKESWDSSAVTLTIVLISEGINYAAVAPDIVLKTTTYIGWVSGKLVPTAIAAGDVEEYAVKLQLIAEPVVLITGGPA